MTCKIERLTIENARKGDPSAFSEIYFALRGLIYGFSYRMLGDQGLAEDITQETFVFLLENFDKYAESRGELHSFLCGVARKKISAFLRKSGNRLEILSDDWNSFEESEVSAQTPLNNLLNRELEDVVEKKISALPALQREVLILRDMEDFSYKEIAEITETELGQVKIRLYRARKKMATALMPYLNQSGEQSYEKL